MKPTLLITVLVGVLLAMGASAADIGYLQRITSQQFHVVTVADWLTVNGKSSPGSITSTYVGQTGFSPEDTTLIVKHEPLVTKRDDGTWAITFPKDGVTVAWQGRLVYAAWRLGHSVEAGTILVNPMGERVERTSDHWSIEYSDKELGLRSDGTVVWREVKP